MYLSAKLNQRMIWMQVGNSIVRRQVLEWSWTHVGMRVAVVHGWVESFLVDLKL
jgi:hypothetical protein